MHFVNNKFETESKMENTTQTVLESQTLYFSSAQIRIGN